MVCGQWLLGKWGRVCSQGNGLGFVVRVMGWGKGKGEGIGLGLGLGVRVCGLWSVVRVMVKVKGWGQEFKDKGCTLTLGLSPKPRFNS